MRRSLVLLPFLVGCLEEQTGAVIDAGSDAALEATADAVADIHPESASEVGPADAPLEASRDAVADTAADAPGKLEASTTASVFGNCMPAVPPDAASITGTLTVKNGTSAAIGPVTLEAGVLRDPTGPLYATFKIDKIDLGTIPPGGTQTSPWKKSPLTWSADPADHICKKCGKTAVVELVVNGLASGGTFVDSPTVTVSCAF